MTEVAASSRYMSPRAGFRELLDRHLIFAVCFAIFMVIALVSRLLPWRWSRSAARRSVFAEARQGADRVTPFCFMS
jgi:hypothetical protein